ncbi:hypothetical protein PoB_006160200 [Plakobranchus ocellatus]|uniref:Uncharacterized protein n=1 Tax=Plakobranchus ocellatus TaxID=259542 RepID=A0AAV4CT79_9GAST|nr:hypothetical protein PoB_006160200 [Plakobranchus ocellatus]
MNSVSASSSHFASPRFRSQKSANTSSPRISQLHPFSSTRHDHRRAHTHLHSRTQPRTNQRHTTHKVHFRQVCLSSTVASESALRSAGTLLSRVRAPPPAP